MNEELGLRTLASVMDWDDDSYVTTEYEWLRLMSRFKYDGYSDFVAGARFVESLIRWLQQFEKGKHRNAAYEYVKASLVYISTAEMRKLVELFYRTVVEPRLMRDAADRFGIPPYRVWAHREAALEFAKMRRRTLFMGLSDGARMDVLRHVNHGLLVHDQLVGHTQLDKDKWRDLMKKLRSDKVVKDTSATFSSLYVLDDLVASGTTLLRRDPDTHEWDGKLTKLRKSISEAEKDGAIFDAGWTLNVHHYVANEAAVSRIETRAVEAQAQLPTDRWFTDIRFSYGAIIPGSTALQDERDVEMCQLIDHYYDAEIEKEEHLRQAGIANLKRGYAACGLPLVLDHNTPNNSLAILWAESSGSKGPAMQPLFRRRQRHT